MFLLRVLFLPFSVCVTECLSLIRMHVSFKGIVLAFLSVCVGVLKSYKNACFF